jgi:hypothetical protein
MKTIIIVITQARIVRDFLRTDVLKILKSERGLRIVLAVLHSTPFFNSKEFAAEFGRDNVMVENVDVKTNVIERALRKAAEIVVLNASDIETIKIKDSVLKEKNYPAYLQLKIVKRILGRNKNFAKALEKFNMLLFSYKHKKYKNLFEKYSPSLLLSTDYVYPHEWGLVKAAKHYKVPIIMMVPSWDFFTTKGGLPTKPDKVIVWNDILKKQLVDYYGYKPDEIFVSGIPQFDCYVQDADKILSRKDFLKEIGAPLDKKLITYTTSPPTLSPLEQDVIEIICEAIKNGEIKYPSHLHVRFHPRDDFERHEKLKKYGDIISFEKPGKSATQEKYEWNPDEKDMLHFASLLHHSDVIINVCSTVTIDASAFGTPVINVAFDGHEKKPYWNSVVRYYDYTHYKDIVNTGGVKIAWNKNELIDYINEYLKNPNLDGSGRKSITEKMCYKLDGKSGERITRYILNFLNESGRIK